MKLAVVLCLLSASAMAQLTFEIASVKPTPPNPQGKPTLLGMEFCRSNGSFSASNTPVFWPLKYAFRLQDYQIVQAPSWMHDFSTFDIEAKPPKIATNEECRQMLQTLFAERFKLVSHRDSKEMQVYLLVPANGGSKLKEGGGLRLNGSMMVENDGKPSFPDGWPMPRLAAYLSDFAGRPVVDRTGLVGTYGITLEFSRNETDGKPSLFTAVQEQLGLRLEPGKAPVEVMVIDHIEKPGAN